MARTGFISVTAIGLLLASLPTLNASADSPPEVIQFNGTTGRPMEAPGVYPRIYSGAVEFSHAKHFSAYGATCGDCHHADAEYLDANSSAGDVMNCEECHAETGLVYGGPADEMPVDELVFYRANVVHRLCIGCHERSSAEARALIAPLACRGCHAQRSRDYRLR